MMDKLQSVRWDGAISHWKQNLKVEAPQLLWGLRMLMLVLALLAGLYAALHFVSLMTSAGKGGGAMALSQGDGLAREPAVALDVNTVKSWGWDSDPLAGNVDASLTPTTTPQDDLKQTRLQMRLEGIVKSDVDENSVAIIAIEEKSKQYKNGAKLPVAPGVYLRRIDVDRIVLDNNGSLEELLLFTKAMLEQRRTVVSAPMVPDQGRVIDKSANADVTSMMGRYREQIQQNPGSFNELIKFSVHTEDGKLAGFKIRAANKPNDFAELGLEDGDVVTHINGVELSDYPKALDLYMKMGTMSEVRVQLMRGGQPQELVFHLPDQG